MLLTLHVDWICLQKAFKHPAPTPSSSPVPEASPSAPFSQTPSTYTPEQQQMIQQFAAQSGMNHGWSIKYVMNLEWCSIKNVDLYTLEIFYWIENYVPCISSFRSIRIFVIIFNSKLIFNYRCLEQNGWNYEKSGEIFLELQVWIIFIVEIFITFSTRFPEKKTSIKFYSYMYEINVIRHNNIVP